MDSTVIVNIAVINIDIAVFLDLTTIWRKISTWDTKKHLILKKKWNSVVKFFPDSLRGHK